MNDDTVLERLAEITAYIEAHHREKIVLEDMLHPVLSEQEYFSRFFRQKVIDPSQFDNVNLMISTVTIDPRSPYELTEGCSWNPMERSLIHPENHNIHSSKRTVS